MASDLDRVDHHRRSADWVSNLWRADDAKLLKLDEESRFTTNVGGSKLRMTKPFVEYDSQRHRLLGHAERHPDLRGRGTHRGRGARLPRGRLPAERQRARHRRHRGRGHQLAPGRALLRPVRWGDPGHQRWLCPALRRLRRGPLPAHRPGRHRRRLDDDDRLLLGGQPSWGNRVSVLAGFVEVGESLEQTIHREIGEEADIEVGETRYFGSQPWPFPRSLMVGYFARAASTAICVDADELDHAAWMSREDVRSPVASGEIGLPGGSSIASRMIDAWLDGEPDLI